MGYMPTLCAIFATVLKISNYSNTKRSLFLKKRNLEIKHMLFFLKNQSKHIVHSKIDYNPVSFFSDSPGL